MIVRIATEGQYELSESDAEGLSELDNQVAVKCQAGDEQQFHDAFTKLIGFVRSHGEPVPEETLATSDVIIPPPDVSLEEAKETFTGEGLIPG
jgi:hypothetical protein